MPNDTYESIFSKQTLFIKIAYFLRCQSHNLISVINIFLTWFRFVAIASNGITLNKEKVQTSFNGGGGPAVAFVKYIR